MLELIRSRRSIRQYLDKVPEDKLIQQILEAGSWAPSGLNNQPWRFVVINDKKTIGEVAKFTQYSKIIKDAPILIAVFLDGGSSYNRDKDLMAIGACIQNMLLEVHRLNLGACWLGEILNQKEQVEKCLKIEEDAELMAVITLGYPDEQITQGCRKTLKSLILKEI